MLGTKPGAPAPSGTSVGLPTQDAGGFDPSIGGGADPARSGESPREREMSKMGGAGVAPRRPSSPSIGAGASFQSGASSDGPQGVKPFSPMGSADVGMLASPARRGLYGRAGGLQGGGLGVPLDPTSDQESDSIESLIQALMQGMGQGGRRF